MLARSLCAIGLMVLAPAAALAQDASVIVVPSKAKGGPNLAPQVRNLVEKQLKKNVKVLPLKTYQKAGRKAGVKPKDLTSPDTAVVVGNEAGVSHVLFIEGQVEQQKVGKKKKKVFFAAVTLVQVATGGQVLTSRFELKGNKLNPKIAGSLIEEVLAALRKPPAPAELPEEPAEELAVEAVPPPPPPPPAGGEGSTDVPPPPPDAPPAPEGETVVAAAEVVEPVEAAPEPASEPASSEAGVLVASITASDAASVSAVAPEPERAGAGARPALHIGVGAAGLYRTAKVISKSKSPYEYSGGFPGAVLHLDFYPLSIGGRGFWYEGIGLHAEGQFLRAQTDEERADGSVASSKSDVVAGDAQLAYRLVFSDSASSPDLTVRAGYSLYVFPLNEVSFPGARYRGPSFGPTINVPFIDEFGVFAGGSFSPALTLGGKLKRLGAVKSGWSVRAELGAWLFFDPLEIKAVGRFEQFSASFSGANTMPDWPSSYTDIELTDRSIGGFLTAGVTF